MILADVAADSCRACGNADESDLPRCFIGDGSGIFQTVQNGRRVKHQTECIIEFRGDAVQPVAEPLNPFRFQVKTDSAGNDDSASEPVPADRGGHVEKFAADASAVGRGRQVGNVARQCAEVSGSQAIARIACARSDTRLAGSNASRIWQYAAADEVEVSPAAVSITCRVRLPGPPRSMFSIPRC